MCAIKFAGIAAGKIDDHLMKRIVFPTQHNRFFTNEKEVSHKPNNLFGGGAAITSATTFKIPPPTN